MQVNHSQKLNDKPLYPWVVAEQSGKVVCGHCNCKAGLGESCSHVASLLWAVEAGVRVRNSMTVTRKKAYWLMPHAMKDVPYASVKKINFVGKRQSLAKFHSYGECSSASFMPCTTTRSSKTVSNQSFEEPKADEKESLFASLSTCGTRPAILSLVEPYASEYVPRSLDSSLSPCFSELYRPECLHMQYSELMKSCESCNITVTQLEADAVESATKSQTQSRLWFNMRTGRITASRFKAACHTDPASPSISLIMSVCHPEMSRFKAAATSWGCQHEKSALEKYKDQLANNHRKFSVEEAGLFISTTYPFVAATPDGLVSCDCCGHGLCEIKVN